MPQPELLLRNQICFRVYALEREILSAYRPLLKKLGLTYPQYLAMMVLWEKGETDVGELCSELALDTGTVSPLLKRLEAAGLLERRRSKLDERSVRVSITRKGESLEEKAAALPRYMAGCMFGGPEGGDAYLALREALDAARARLRERPAEGS